MPGLSRAGGLGRTGDRRASLSPDPATVITMAGMETGPAQSYPRPRDLDAATRVRLLACEEELHRRSAARAREVFESRPEHAAPLDGLEAAPAARPLAEWEAETGVVRVAPRQSLADFASRTERGVRIRQRHLTPW